MTKKAIFLSASVPDINSDNFIFAADSVAITSAVKSLAYVLLGRRQIIWGGHPAITPMIWAVAKSMGVDYGSWVKLYQSQYFEDKYPEDNQRFQNVVYTKKVLPDLNASLKHMRVRMFQENEYSAAIFIGGMKGIIDECSLFREINPNVPCYPIFSTEGATLELRKMCTIPNNPKIDLDKDIDYVPLFHTLCDVNIDENRSAERLAK